MIKLTTKLTSHIITASTTTAITITTTTVPVQYYFITLTPNATTNFIAPGTCRTDIIITSINITIFSTAFILITNIAMATAIYYWK